jgi:putative phosphoribosyl transferase
MNATISEEMIEVPMGSIVLHGDVRIPPRPSGLVIFAHGSGSSRFSSRNRQVAESLHMRGLATLLMDLLTPQEESVDTFTSQYRFDIPRLGERVTGAADWAKTVAAVCDLPIGLFGASTGAAAALMAAADRPDLVAAVVSRGGRPDLAGEALARVVAPTMLIVGSADHTVIELNRKAMRRMTAEVELQIVAGATHLFEEPGTLEEVERLAGEWFEQFLD